MTAVVMPFQVKDEEPEPQAGPVRLNLGANQHPMEGYINVDAVQYAGVDTVADLEKRWPWADDSVDEIYTADLPEHLRGWYEVPDPFLVAAAKQYLLEGNYTQSIDRLISAIENPKRTYGVLHFMNESWRVLKPGGLLRARIPTTESKAWAQDPTHVSFWNENTLLYFTHPQYRAIYPNDIKAHFAPLEVKTLMPNHYGEAWVVAVLRKVPL